MGDHCDKSPPGAVKVAPGAVEASHATAVPYTERWRCYIKENTVKY
jgi:hypothetical protein